MKKLLLTLEEETLTIPEKLLFHNLEDACDYLETKGVNAIKRYDDHISFKVNNTWQVIAWFEYIEAIF